MSELVKVLVLVCPLVFLAGFIDSVAGGGGVVSLSAYLIAGLPAHMAAGSNKFTMSFGTSVAAAKYMRSGKVLLSVALPSAAGALAGSAIGANLALLIEERALQLVLLGALPCVALFLALSGNFGMVARPEKTDSRLAVACKSLGIGLLIGGYDGLIGPGTGSFLILAFSGMLGMDLLTASGCAKVSNLASNIAALLVFIPNGKVYYAAALPAMLFCMAGNWVGAQYAIKGGSARVKKMMWVVLALLFIKTVMDLLGLRF